MENIYRSLLNCKDTNLNPTIIYNEGWMTRLLVEYSIKENIIVEGIEFGNIAKWTSEALISSPFIDCKDYREGYTHTDIAFGDYEINYTNQGKLTLIEPKVFGIIEAKMKSNLSKGTMNFGEYNQATRNLVCLAHNISNMQCETYFMIVAPDEMILKHKILEKVSLENVLEQVNHRFDVYDKSFKDEKKYTQILENIKNIKIIVISYEEWIKKFTCEETRQSLLGFYQKCLKWNGLKEKTNK